MKLFRTLLAITIISTLALHSPRKAQAIGITEGVLIGACIGLLTHKTYKAISKSNSPLTSPPLTSETSENVLNINLKELAIELAETGNTRKELNEAIAQLNQNYQKTGFYLEIIEDTQILNDVSKDKKQLDMRYLPEHAMATHTKYRKKLQSESPEKNLEALYKDSIDTMIDFNINPQNWPLAIVVKHRQGALVNHSQNLSAVLNFATPATPLPLILNVPTEEYGIISDFADSSTITQEDLDTILKKTLGSYTQKSASYDRQVPLLERKISKSVVVQQLSSDYLSLLTTLLEIAIHTSQHGQKSFTQTADEFEKYLLDSIDEKKSKKSTSGPGPLVIP